MKKYELTKTAIYVNEKPIYQIRALRDFGNIKKYQLGGYIESESNLSHEGDCWVGGNAKVYENAYIYENAQILGNSCVFGDVRLSGSVLVHGFKKLSGDFHASGCLDFS